MRAHVDGGDDDAVVAADRHRDRAEARLGLAIDQGIALRAIGDDGRNNSFGSVTVCGVIGSRFIFAKRCARSASSNRTSITRPTEVQNAGRR